MSKFYGYTPGEIRGLTVPEYNAYMRYMDEYIKAQQQ